MKLDSSVQYLIGVGPKVSEKLERLGIKVVRDLLFYYPWRYDDFSSPQKISSLRIGDDAIIEAKIINITKAYTKRRWMTLIEAELKDDSGKIKAIWFNQPFLTRILKPGDVWLFAGKIAWDFKNKIKTLNISQYEKDPNILPVYNETKGLTSKYLRKLIRPLAKEINIEEYLLPEILKSEDLIGINEAVQNIHFPKDSDILEKAKQRLAFDELFFISLLLQQTKKELSQNNAIQIKSNTHDLQKFTKNLPFKLTNAQRKTAWEIICDLKKSKPMNRLLEGDVGSGKTVVATMAALVVAKAGFQTVWLAPTEILANQHYLNITKLLKLYKIKVGLWTGSKKGSDLLKDDLIIGTHALIEKGVTFKNLAFIIVDEQHRFGVKQRAYLRQIGGNTIPHFLSMTATPIPRTLALAYYSDLDLSIIDELPKERKKVLTKIVPPEKRQAAYEFIRNQVKLGRQVFVICPLIEEGQIKDKLFDLDRKSAVKEYEKLSKEIFPELKIGLIHGKLKSKEKEKIMSQFKNGKINILVATAVVEVGIDIANATVMMVESAERFGLAQLHQFRGRVGRSKHQSYCFLFSENSSENTKKRLKAMTTCNNGFELAQIDLELRGPGELTGIRQSGLPDLKMAALSDRIMIEQAQKRAAEIINVGIEKYPVLHKKLQEFMTTKHLE